MATVILSSELEANEATTSDRLRSCHQRPSKYHAAKCYPSRDVLNGNKTDSEDKPVGRRSKSKVDDR